MPDQAEVVRSTIRKTEEQQTDGSVKYCVEFDLLNNETENDIYIVVSDNPWWPDENGGMGPKEYEDRVLMVDKQGNPKIDPATGEQATQPDFKRQRKRALERWVNPEAAENDEIDEKAPLRIPAGESKRVKLCYNRKPWGTYADIYVVDKDFQIADDISEQQNLPDYDDQVTKPWENLHQQSFYRNGPRHTRAVAFPLPYPMIVHDSHDGDIEIVVDGVGGLPPGHKIIHIFPPIGVPYALDEGDRMTSGALFIKQVRKDDPGHYIMAIDYHVHRPDKLRRIRRTVEIDLIIPSVASEQNSLRQDIPSGESNFRKR